MDISAEIAAIQAASQGSELRQPLVGALNKLNSGSLPAVTASDAGKILKVGANGWEVGEKSGYMPVPTDTMQITDNGTYDVTNYASANVYVSGGGSAVLVSKTITQNGTYDPADDNADGYSSVIVNVSQPINDNIAANWNFTQPINNRGGTSWNTSSLVWTIDGWGIYRGGIEIVNGGICVKRTQGDAALFQQRLKSDWVTNLLNKTLTLSMLVDDVFGYETIAITSSSGNQGNALNVNGIFLYFYRDSTTEMPLYIYSNNAGNDNKVIKAVKVEFGSVQTLCHQENGVWILNDETYNQDLEYVKTRAMLAYN